MFDRGTRLGITRPLLMPHAPPCNPLFHPQAATESAEELGSEDSSSEDDEDMELGEGGSVVDLPSYEFRFETAKLLLELDESVEAASEVGRAHSVRPHTAVSCAPCACTCPFLHPPPAPAAAPMQTLRPGRPLLQSWLTAAPARGVPASSTKGRRSLPHPVCTALLCSACMHSCVSAAGQG